MKKFKLFIAVITVFSLLFTVVSAASVLKFGAETVEYTEGSELTISVYATEEFTCAAGTTFELVFDNNVWAYKSSVINAEVTADGYVYGEEATFMPNALSVQVSASANKTLAADQKIVDITFEKIAGDAVGTEFTLDFDVYGGNFFTPDGTVMEFSDKITVKGAASEPTPVTGEAVDGVLVTYAKSANFVDTFYGAYSYTASLDAETGFSKAGFTWSSNKSENTFDYVAVDGEGEVLSGDGAFEYTVIMYGIPEGTVVTGTPYYYAK